MDPDPQHRFSFLAGGTDQQTNNFPTNGIAQYLTRAVASLTTPNCTGQDGVKKMKHLRFLALLINLTQF